MVKIKKKKKKKKPVHFVFLLSFLGKQEQEVWNCVKVTDQ